ncbi:hypothetical protein EGW08_001050 [Elysia chlorotica]|uniref:Uncharacterized protein n=1 Tax=Elysia chlorotica TaxID=188477 RepID=A0A3S1A5F5_ELYCH|nr:hypothetical protein EGW08_001050 [Elysia chlorotica]
MSLLVHPVTPLLWRACLTGDDALIDLELGTGRADPHKLDRNGESCLHMAARGGSTKGLQRLLGEGITPITMCHTCRLLYQQDCQTELERHRRSRYIATGQTALHVAASLDSVDLVRTIVAGHGADPDLPTKYSGMTALHLACRLGHQGSVQCLLDCGANCAIRDQINKWPDHYTANKTILNAFDRHFDVCTHGRRRGSGLHSGSNNTNSSFVSSSSTQLDSALTSVENGDSATANGDTRVTRDAAGVAIISDDTETDRLRAQHYGAHACRDGAQYGNIHRADVQIFDEWAKYDPDRDNMEAGATKRNDKKWKINHKMDFSDQHKKRMQQNVFDRLLHASKKKDNA